MGKKIYSEEDIEKPSSKRISYKLQPGPIERRSCRDILFLIIFLAFWFGMFFIASVAVKYGDPNKLM